MLKTEKLRIGGMTCVNCENKIAKKLRNTTGVEKAAVSYNKGELCVTYDNDLLSANDIAAIIKKLDYQVLSGSEGEKTSLFDAILIIMALYMLMQHLGLSGLFDIFPLAEVGMSYLTLFVLGLFTSIHCLAMCGGINLSQCMGQKANGKGLSTLQPSFLYNFGRVLSYTLVGAIVGTLGSVISFSNTMKGALQIATGVFMLLMGLNMLGIAPSLRKLVPRMPAFLARKNDAARGSRAPFYVGLLNGLMPCGPLQAMQIYALSTGDTLQGALSMLVFSLGTVPLMFGFGALSSFLSKNFAAKVMNAGALLVLIMGLAMFNNGLSLADFSGFPSLAASSDNRATSAQVKIENGVQLVSTSLASGRYTPITVKAGLPVKWVIDAPKGSINGCNNRMLIREYGIEHKFTTGQNVVEFTPQKTGRFQYSCWMGMIRSSITVVE